MKRLSAVILAAILTLSLCAPAQAKLAEPTVPLQPVDATGFTDAVRIDHWDAVYILAHFGIISGKDDGAFHPTDPVTRGEMAKLVCLIALGGEDFHPTMTPLETPFSDTKGHWAQSYIAWCARKGALAGRGDGTFDPDAEVTQMEAIKMILTALLRYEPMAFGLVGKDWETATMDLACEADLFRNLRETEPLTRDIVAQLLLNALEAPVVDTFWDSVDLETGEVTYEYKVGVDILLEQNFGRNACYPRVATQPKR